MIVLTFRSLSRNCSPILIHLALQKLTEICTKLRLRKDPACRTCTYTFSIIFLFIFRVFVVIVFFVTVNIDFIRAIPLSDLTFTEDGNPDELHDDKSLINFAKRELICNIIRQVQLNQQPPYMFPVVEPLNTFLRELPYADEKSLYDLSLIREPR